MKELLSLDEIASKRQELGLTGGIQNFFSDLCPDMIEEIKEATMRMYRCETTTEGKRMEN